MSEKNVICDLLKNGTILFDVEGNNTTDIYDKVSKSVVLPSSVTKENVFAALCDRERVMSTAVGYGIALPHCRGTILKDNSEQQISVCYLKNPLDMKAPDTRYVYVMFVLLTANSQTHLQVLSQLAALFKNEEFRKLLESHASKEEIIEAAQKIIP